MNILSGWKDDEDSFIHLKKKNLAYAPQKNKDTLESFTYTRSYSRNVLKELNILKCKITQIT